MNPVIEREQPADHAAVRAVVRAAFAESKVADLVELIRASPEFVPDLALVARVEDAVAGFVMLSHAELVAHSGKRHRVLAGLREAERLGEQLVLLEGSPRYYPRFGFRDCRELGIQIKLPDWAPPDAGMACPLSSYDPRVRGRLAYPPAFAATGTGLS